jgi:hypothetical protein
VKNLILLVILVAGAAFAGAKWHMHSKVADGVDIAFMTVAPFAEVSYQGVSSTLSGQLTIDGVSVRINGFSDEIRIDRIGIETPSFLHLLDLADITSDPMAVARDMPEYFGFIAEGIRVPVDADYFHRVHDFKLAALAAQDAGNAAAECVGKYGFSPAALSAMGYEEQVLSVSVLFRQQERGFVLEIVSSAEEMWDVGVEMRLAGDMLTEFMKGAAYRPRMSDLRIEYVDRSLNQRIRKYCTRKGLSDEEIFAAQMEAFRFMGEANGIVFDEYMTEPYKDFLAGKPLLVITAKPSEPISLSQLKLYKPSDVPALLDLSATAM